MSQQTHHDWLAARPFTLALSAGFFGFYAHTGFLLALEEARLRPRRVVGVSAGALAGGIYASGVPLVSLADELLQLRREAFWDLGLPVGGLLKGRKFARLLRRVLGQGGVERLERCPIPFAPVVFDVLRRETFAVEAGHLGDAIRASCALPGLFRPVAVDGRWCVDGGVRDRGGHTALALEERTLLHHLPSKSPWRVVSGTQPCADSDTRRTLLLPTLPRVTPFALHVGGAALQEAREATLRWLDGRMS